MTATQPTAPHKGWQGFLIETEIHHFNLSHVYATKIEVQSFGKKRGTCTLAKNGEMLKKEIWPGQIFLSSEGEIQEWIEQEMPLLIAKSITNVEFRIERSSIYKGEEKLADLINWKPSQVEIRFK